MLEGTNPASRFPCSAIGYEAACYSRIWSEVCQLTITLIDKYIFIFLSKFLMPQYSQVFAADVYASKFRDGLLNQYVGMQFRKKVNTSIQSKTYCSSVFKKFIVLVCLCMVHSEKMFSSKT